VGCRTVILKTLPDLQTARIWWNPQFSNVYCCENFNDRETYDVNVGENSYLKAIYTCQVEKFIFILIMCCGMSPLRGNIQHFNNILHFSNWQIWRVKKSRLIAVSPNNKINFSSRIDDGCVSKCVSDSIRLSFHHFQFISFLTKYINEWISILEQTTSYSAWLSFYMASKFLEGRLVDGLWWGETDDSELRSLRRIFRPRVIAM
jgi:hypothetical protein